MSRVPGTEALELLQGNDFDETWDFWENDAATVATDLSTTVAEWRFAKDTETAPFLTLTSAGPPASPPAADGLYITGNHLRIFIRGATLKALDESAFDRSECDGDGERVFLGINTLEFTKAGYMTRENQGEVRFSPAVEPAPV